MLLLLLLVTTSSVILLLHAGYGEFSEVIEDAKRDTSRLAFTVAAEIKALTNSTRDLGETLSLMDVVPQRDASKVEPLLAKLIAGNPVYANIVLLDRSGNVWASGIPLRGRKVSMADRKYFVEAMSSGKFSVGEYTFGRTSRKHVLTYGIPVKGPDGKPAGCIAIGYDLDHFKHTFEKIFLPSNANFTLLDHKGIVVFRLISSEKHVGTSYPPDEFQLMRTGPPEKTDVGMGIDGVRRIESYMKLALREGDPPFMYVIAGMPYEPIVSESLRAYMGRALILVSIMLFVVLVAWSIGKRFILDPVASLKDAIYQVSKGNFDVRISGLMKATELRNVEPAFDAMASALSENTVRRERAEAGLRESEDRYRDLVEHSQDLICTHDLKGRLLSVNPWAGRILGYSQDELLRMNMRDLLMPEVRDQFEGYLENIGKQGTARGTLLVRARNGEQRIWEYNNTLRTEGVTEPIVRGMAQDVTERIRAEKALRDTTRRLQLAATSAGLGIWEWDIQRDALHWDHRMFELYGIPGDTSLTGVERWKKSLHPDDFDAAMEASQAAVRGEKEYDTEFRVVHRDGTIRFLQANAVVIRDADGKALRMIGINRDITEQRRMELQLQQAMKMEAVGRLAGGIAHDFNNLLTAIIGNISLALMKLSLSDPSAGMLGEAKKASERAARLTQQLLAFSRKQIIEPKVLDLNDLVAGMRTMLARLIGEHIELRTVPGVGLGSVKVDPGQIEQILMNLAVNARDAMPDGGKLFIETANAELDADYCARHPDSNPGRFVMLAVIDTGHGMSEEVRKQIFEPFFTTKPKGSGTGLGLSTAYGAVRQSGGSIEVSSEEGRGTTFRIYLPMVEGKISKPERNNGAMDLPEGSETILVVEDEEIVRRLCVNLLEWLGYTVLQASNGVEAIALTREHTNPIALLITDVVMPGMNGRDLAEHLVLHYPEMKVLFTSGYTDEAIVHHGVLDEGVAFIGKPYALSGLAKKIREVLDGA